MMYWVFDLDGTLVDSFGHYFKCLKTVFSEFDKDFPESLHYPALTDLLTEFLQTHLGKDSIAAMERLRTQSDLDAVEIKPFPGVIPFLDHLRSQGMPMAIWTNRDFRSANLILEHSGLRGYFQEFVSGSCVKAKKPNPEGLLKILDSLGCEAHRVTMVGDHEHDVWGAKTLSARSVRASWHSYWEIEKCNAADHQFFTFDEFAKWVQSERLVSSAPSPLFDSLT